MTEKENYLMLLRGEQPEWVPHYAYGPNPLGRPTPNGRTGPTFLMEHVMKPGVQKDIWGVNHIPVPEAAGAKIPQTYDFILKDIRDWRDVIKAPDLSDVDWKMMAKKDIDASPYDRSQTALSFGLHPGYFQLLASFMGFSEGMCAMYEEPEEVKALVEYLSDFYMEIARNTIDLYQPDTLNLVDDIATVTNPFFSLEMYREIFKPYYRQLAQLAIDRGIPCEMHCCGHCEIFIDDWVNDLNVRAWNPAQTSNDLLAIKEKYRGRLAIVGAYDYSKQPLEYDTEEKIKQSVYETIDRYAPGGGYAFAGSFLGAEGDEQTKRKNRWLAEAVEEYGRDFYRRH